VIVGADSRGTSGNIICHKGHVKLHRITDSIYAAGAGGAADLHMVFLKLILIFCF
jgi:20S proteasome subunit beta 2